MKRLFNIFKVHKDERCLALVSVIIFTCLNALTVCKYYGSFSKLYRYYHDLFVHTFHVSGFDPLTYEVISDWVTAYNIYRHPLLAFFVYPFYWLDQGMMELTGMNFATIITALILVFCATYSCLFLYRILKEVIETSRVEAYVICGFYFSFAFIMLAAMVPDHFIMSMMALLLTLYISGKKLKSGSTLGIWQTIILFFVIGGISLNNGLKVFLAALLTRRRHFFNWKFLLFAVILPCAMIWEFAGWEYKTYQLPREIARYELKVKKRHAKAVRDSLLRLKRDSIAKLEPAKPVAEVKDTISKATAKPKQKARSKYTKHGKPLGKGSFMEWTDGTTSRWDAIVENLFGEGIQLHSEHLLQDVLTVRPIVVKYNSWFNYLVELFVVGLFIIGIWCGRKSAFLWTAMSFFLIDMVLHLGLGFGIDEIYIMSPHYLYVIPIAVAFIFKTRLMAENTKLRIAFTSSLGLLALWCWAWNIRLLLQYML